MDEKTLLFTEDCSYTDDTVLTCAIIDSVINKIAYRKSLKQYGLSELKQGKDMYGRNRFSKGYIEWLAKEEQGISNGNGAPMRISPIGFLFNDEKSVQVEAKFATIPSHNSVEAVRGAQAVANAIYQLRSGVLKIELKKNLERKFGYDLNFDLEELRHNYGFFSNCDNTVPQAIFCFLLSNGFEEAIRMAYLLVEIVIPLPVLLAL